MRRMTPIANATLQITLVFGLATVAAQAPAPQQPIRAIVAAAGAGNGLSELRAWDDRVNSLVRTNGLALRTYRADTVIEGRAHERYDQYFRGVRVFGGDVSRQVQAGVTESIFGSLYDGIDIGIAPGLSEADARRVFGKLAGSTLGAARAIELVVLPRDDGSYSLTWRSHLWRDAGWWNTFIDAHSGETVLEYNDLQTQAAVGTGTGVVGDQKKISTNSVGGQYTADDQLRPPVLITYDMRGNRFKVDAYLDGLYTPTPADLASDPDNMWTDAANVDGHVHVGWTYDYYFKRFGRRGLDDREAPIYSVTHPVLRSDLQSLPDSAIATYMLNASWCGGCGPRGDGAMVFGEGLPQGYVVPATGQYWDYLAGGLDVVAHELTHGLTEYSSNLVYRNESGALNESFSDILGTSVEFFYQATGAHTRPADYLIAEDVVRPGGLRSMEAPRVLGQPDHYSRKFTGAADNGGVHINSGIPNNAFYLAVEGGVNQTSGLRVQGVGAANREQIEKVFYRAFVSFLPSNATFAVARAATIQSARDLYGAGGAAERAVTDAWTAVGVN
jgi:bacillolysin